MTLGAQPRYDAIVVGSGPNGLAAAVTIAQTGRSVLVCEAHDTIGGGTRSAELTLPGVVHDVCSAVHPMAVSSPFFSTLPLSTHGLEWIQPPTPLAHPLDDGTAVVLERSLESTARGLGADGDAYRTLMSPMVEHWEQLKVELLAPLRVPAHPLMLAGFGLKALRSASGLAKGRFRDEPARALLAGLAAHSMLRLDQLTSVAIGLVLAAAGHSVGWPIPRGGSQHIANALASYLRSLGGEIVTGARVDSIDELPAARMVLCDVSPAALLRLAGTRLTAGYRRALGRYRYGLGAFKVDYAMSAPVPWTAAACTRAGTVHLGGTLSEVEASEREAWEGKPPLEPFVLLAQPSLFDSTRAPKGTHTVWAYCHVPNGSDVDMTERIEQQIERFAPGFTQRVIARSVRPPAVMERENANLVGGDINGGVQDLRQLFLRPTRHTYSTSAPGLYICSASTPPGGGVHGMCGYHAARQALADLHVREKPHASHRAHRGH